MGHYFKEYTSFICSLHLEKQFIGNYIFSKVYIRKEKRLK